MADYDIQIEIDQDTGNITWVHNGIEYNYAVEELEGKDLIFNIFRKTGAEITVYSQGQTYTIEEYLEATGLDRDYTPAEYLVAIGV